MKRIIFAVTLAAMFMAGASASAQSLSSLNQLLAKPTGEQASVAAIGKGKVTVVSFWATWCKPCKEEMRAMYPMIQKLQGKVEYVAISIDDTKTMAKVGPYVSSKGYSFTVLLDPNRDLFRALNGTDVPYTLVYKADGTLHSKHDGFLAGDEVRMEKELLSLLGEMGTETVPATEPVNDATTAPSATPNRASTTGPINDATAAPTEGAASTPPEGATSTGD